MPQDTARSQTLCADKRVQINSAGQVVLGLKTPWSDGTTHIVMSPLGFMQRLSSLVQEVRAERTDDPVKALKLAVQMPGLGRPTASAN